MCRTYSPYKMKGVYFSLRASLADKIFNLPSNLPSFNLDNHQISEPVFVIRLNHEVTMRFSCLFFVLTPRPLPWEREPRF